MKTSSTLVSGTTKISRGNTVKRQSLEMGDLFKRQTGGKVYEHTGLRTQPPSEVGKNTPTWGKIPSGKLIIGFQSRVVKGAIDDGEDGATVSFDGNSEVYHVGKASISLGMF